METASLCCMIPKPSMKSSMRTTPGWMGSRLSVIVDEFDILSTSIVPGEADPPLIIDSNAVLPRPVVFQRLQPIAGRHTQRVEKAGGVDLRQLSEDGLLDTGINRWQLVAIPEPLSRLVGEGPDHATSVAGSTHRINDVRS